jgi:capsular exopolysaccharide synthesis family protein
MKSFGKIKSNVDNEIEIIKSRTLAERTINKLQFNITYTCKGRFKTIELYPAPIIAQWFSKSDSVVKPTSFTIRWLSASSFYLTGNGYKDKVVRYEEKINTPQGELIVFKAKGIPNKFTEIVVSIQSIQKAASGYFGRLSIATVSDNTSVLELGMTDAVPKKAEDYLTALVDVYIQDAIDDKSYVSMSTSRFVEERIRKIAEELNGTETDKERYQIQNKIVGQSEDSGLFLQNATEFERREIDIETQIKIVETMMSYLNKSGFSDLLPANILTADAGAGGMIENYNQLVLDRNRLLKNAAPENPVVAILDAKIKSSKEGILATLLRLKASLGIKQADLHTQNSKLSGKLTNLPSIEKEMRGLGRQQQIKESLYLYLLQKREETAIALAVTQPNAKIIDAALASPSPIAPKRSLILLCAILLGSAIPFGILFLMRLLDTKVKSREDVLSRLHAPFLGDVPKSFSSSEIITKESSSSSAESIRFIRTNLEFLLIKADKNKAKTIFVTSTLPKEGKTFITVNLAGSIALSNKKVLVLDLDVRNSKLANYIQVSAKGVTNFVTDTALQLEDLILKVPGFDSLYVLGPGAIPPNPAELLMNERLGVMFEKLKEEYDYIIVDTPPVSLVTDTIIVANQADAFIFVVRENYLDKTLLEIPEQLRLDNKLPNMAVVLNDAAGRKTYGYGAGYGYGYGYGANQNIRLSWHEELIKSIKEFKIWK